MYSLLELSKSTLIGRQIKIYIHRRKSLMDWDIIDTEQPSETYVVRTINDIKFNDCDGLELVLNEPFEAYGADLNSIVIEYTTKFDLLDV